MTDPMTFQLEAADDAKGQVKHLEDAVMRALAGGKLRMFRIEPDGTRTEVYLSEATHSQGHSTFDPKDAKKDKHGPHRGDKKHEDGAVTFTIAPVT
jgi:hypothetical protein